MKNDPGFLARLTEEQRRAALAYRGQENHGDAALRREGWGGLGVSR